MEEITFVTAFFDIGRENYSAVPRSNQKYYDYLEKEGKLESKGEDKSKS